MAAVKSYKELFVVRIILGCLEAGFVPAVILLFSSWYKKMSNRSDLSYSCQLQSLLAPSVAFLPEELSRVSKDRTASEGGCGYS